MNDLEFQLYEALHRMVSVFEYAPNDALQTSMEQGIASIQQNHLQVAIVGEFRRGKSSLINALLGMPILPVDIEPTTATVNRIVYGNKPEAVIHYKNGDAELVSIEDLSKYVTKLTDESASIARNVREAEIRYPTELCRHNIDILDTPGLNDEENMTLVTEQVLQYVDAAIVVIKATMPYSDTECEWVARLIGCENIRHILFAVTCMDLVRPRERQRLTAYLLERITQHTLEKVQNLFSDKPDILQKARRMLESQHILHPVSSLMALESFENGDYDQLEESGLPAFKKQLVTILCAQRQLSSIRHANQMAEKIQTWFSQHAPQNAPMELEAQKQRFLTADDRQKQYFQQRSAQMEQALSQIYPTLPFFPNAAFYDEIMQCFIRCLSSIQEYSNDIDSEMLNNKYVEELLFRPFMPRCRRPWMRSGGRSFPPSSPNSKRNATPPLYGRPYSTFGCGRNGSLGRTTASAFSESTFPPPTTCKRVCVPRCPTPHSSCSRAFP